MIKRYNQGFGGFGPLEQCKDGKLVKWEDVGNMEQEYRNHIYDISQKLVDQSSKKFQLTLLCYASMLINLILIIKVWFI